MYIFGETTFKVVDAEIGTYSSILFKTGIVPNSSLDSYLNDFNTYINSSDLEIFQLVYSVIPKTEILIDKNTLKEREPSMRIDWVPTVLNQSLIDQGLNWLIHEVDSRGFKIQPLGYYTQINPQTYGKRRNFY